jgi:hypothetical protein
LIAIQEFRRSIYFGSELINEAAPVAGCPAYREKTTV